MKYEVLIPMKEGLDRGEFDSTEERFQSAINCSKSVIESILDAYPVEVDVHENIITIALEQTDLFTEDELKEMFKPVFCDGNGYVFPEFGVIKVRKI